MVILVKRRGHAENYDNRKVYASVYSASLNCHLSETQAEEIAERISNDIDVWVRKKDHITSDYIRDKIIETLKEEGKKDIALMYKHHLDLS